jgi:hypothetical protein
MIQLMIAGQVYKSHRLVYDQIKDCMMITVLDHEGVEDLYTADQCFWFQPNTGVQIPLPVAINKNVLYRHAMIDGVQNYPKCLISDFEAAKLIQDSDHPAGYYNWVPLEQEFTRVDSKGVLIDEF